MGPGEQLSGGEQQFSTGRRMNVAHGHLRRNSGAMTSRAKAWVRLSARAMTRGDGTEPALQQRRWIGGRRVSGKLVGNVEPVRDAVDPGRFGIGPAVRRRRPPQRFAE